MRGIATIDRQPGSDTIAVWVTSRGPGDVVNNVNAVVMDAATDPDVIESVSSLTRCCAVLVTEGTTLDGLPIDGAPLRAMDLAALIDEVKSQQVRILEAVKAYKARTRSSTLIEPRFPADPKIEDFQPDEDAAARRAFSLANYAGRVWSTWLKTDVERRRRTVQPKTQVTPWIMPDDMNDQTTPDFPPSFAARLVKQPLV